MASRATHFPAFITDEYRPGNGFSAFERAALATSDQVKRHFEGSMSEVQRIAAQALSMPRTATGSLDINVGQYRQAAQAAQAHAIALREVATAAERAAISNNDSSQETRLYVQAARAAALEAENVARETNQQVVAMERLQTELSQTRSGTQAVIAGNRGLAASNDQVAVSSRGQRFAMVQVGQQFQDMAIQMQAGVGIQQIFVQQVSQMGFALSQLQGRLGAVGRFLAGGWGTAMFLAVAAVGYLTSAFRDNNEAAQLAEAGSTGLAQAQSVLGEMFDLTSGKLERQNELLVLNARLTALNLQAEAMRERQEARDVFLDVGERGTGTRLRTIGVAGPLASRAENIRADQYARQVQSLLAEVAAGRVTSERALDLSRTINFDVLDITREEFQQAIINRVSAVMKEDVARRINETLDTGRLDPMFRREGGRQREDQRPQQADAALERIQRINDSYDEQTRIVDRATQAMRELDTILADASRRKLPRFDEMQRAAESARDSIRDGVVRQITEAFEEQPKLIDRAEQALRTLNEAAAQLGGDRSFLAQLDQARGLVVDALNRPFREFLEDQVRSYEIGELIVQGREEEAEALSIIARLEEQLGPLSDERKEIILESVVALREQADQMQLIRERQGQYLRAADDVRASITDLLANPQQGLSGIGDFISSIGGAFNRLRAEVIVDRLFGGVFRRLEDHVTGRDRVRQANEEMAASIHGARSAIGDLRTAQQDQVQSVEQVISATDRLTQAFETGATRIEAAAAAPVAAAAQIREQMLQPFAGGRVSSGYGSRADPITGERRFHAGIDLPQPYGTDVPAALSGRVSFAGQRGGYGNTVIIDHGNGLQTLYGHLSRIAVSLDQVVRRGEQIGDVGSTGRSTGNHLHYEVRRDGRSIDPRSIGFAEVMVEVGDAMGGAGDEANVAADRLRGLQDVIARLGNTAVTASGSGAELKATIADMMNAGADATVTGHRDPAGRLSPNEFFSRTFAELLGEIIGERAGRVAGTLLTQALAGAGIGQFAATSILGGRSNDTAAQIGGAIGSVVGNMIGGPIGGQIGAAVLGTLGGIAFGSTPRASSTIAFGSGGLEVASTSGTRRLQGQTVTAADSVIATVQRIAELFGGSLTGAGTVSIGIRDGNYRLDPSGRGITKTKKGAIDFGEDAEAAIRAAVLDLIKDGMIAGLKAGTQRLLQSAKDLDSGIDKALKFESVFSRLKEHLDPVGAALDTLDKEFAHLKKIFDEAGASAEEYAELEQLYQLEREQAIRQAGERMTSALRGLLDDLTVNNDALSLRERLAMARAKYDPLAAKLAAGETVDYDAFAEAARTVLDIQRQIAGSTSPYFELLNQITELTRKALADQENLISIATARDPAVGGPDAANDNTVGAIDRLGGHLGGILTEQVGGQISVLNDNLVQFMRWAQANAAGGGGGFPSFDRGNF